MCVKSGAKPGAKSDHKGLATKCRREAHFHPFFPSISGAAEDTFLAAKSTSEEDDENSGEPKSAVSVAEEAVASEATAVATTNEGREKKRD